MPKKSRPGKGPIVAGGFAERLEGGSELSEVCNSRRQLQILPSIVTDLAQKFRRFRARGPVTGFGHSIGPAVLFAGKDANAKAAVVAAPGQTLELDVWRIDLSHVVSKYIGETEKNLRRLS